MRVEGKRQNARYLYKAEVRDVIDADTATPLKALPAAATSANNSPHLRSPSVVLYVSFHHEGLIQEHVMETRELKNYGKSYVEMLPRLPLAVRKRIKRAASRKIRRRLGIWGSLRLVVVARRRERQFQAVDLTPVRERGLVSEGFIREMIRNAALFSAMEERVGQDEARAVFHEIMDEVSRPMNEAILPSVEDLGEDEDAYQVFRDYFLAFFEAEKRDGLHAYELVEDSEKAIAINVTYCAFCEIPRLLGVVEACDPSCYADEVFFPGYLEPMGLRFARTKTLARGGDCCDFRFEKTEGQSPRRTKTRDG